MFTKALSNQSLTMISRYRGQENGWPDRRSSNCALYLALMVRMLTPTIVARNSQVKYMYRRVSNTAPRRGVRYATVHVLDLTVASNDSGGEHPHHQGEVQGAVGRPSIWPSVFLSSIAADHRQRLVAQCFREHVAVVLQSCNSTSIDLMCYSRNGGRTGMNEFMPERRSSYSRVHVSTLRLLLRLLGSYHGVCFDFWHESTIVTMEQVRSLSGVV